jgi:ATP-dependent exoDNAse (exonuclease V) alpha subunit
MHGPRVFRAGDKVIQIRNNYDKDAAGVFNGTVGTITALSLTDRQLTVRTDEDEDITYDSTNSTSSSTPTPSPCTAPKAANTRAWSCR